MMDSTPTVAMPLRRFPSLVVREASCKV